MEKQTGVVLDDVWESLTGKQKARIVLQVVDFEKALASTKFTRLGALYYNNEIPAKLDTELPLYADSDGNAVYSEKFGIGPTNHRSFFDFEKGTLDIDRGPCKSSPNSLINYFHILTYAYYFSRVNDYRFFIGGCTQRDCLRKSTAQIPTNSRGPFLWS